MNSDIKAIYKCMLMWDDEVKINDYSPRGVELVFYDRHLCWRTETVFLSQVREDK